VFSGISSMLLRIYQATLNIKMIGMENLLWTQAKGNNYILTLWHTFVDGAIFAFHSRNILIYSDHPRNHKYENSMAHFFREVGIKTLRGFDYNILDASLDKQSAGIIRFIHNIKSGSPALVAPDGPSGPIYKAKPGSVYIASKTNAVILPVGFAFSDKISGPNWDDFALPLPFSQLVVNIGKPIMVPFKCSSKEQSIYTQKLEDELDRLTFEAQTYIT